MNADLRSTAMIVAAVAAMAATPCIGQDSRALAEVKAVAEDAHLYGFPMIVNKVMYEPV
jgi:hypothetical protein